MRSSAFFCAEMRPSRLFRVLVLPFLAINLCRFPRHALASSVDLIRGIPRSQQAQYTALKSQGLFECQESPGVKIPFNYVNDDYCDCPDFSDEPGTSACHGRFYCLNKGHVGNYISSSKVEDGICDCCDGSDEAQGTCPNTCSELAASSRAQRAEKIRLLEQGAVKKRDYIEEGNKAAEDRRRILGERKLEVERRRAALEESEARKVELEAKEKENQAQALQKEVASAKTKMGWSQKTEEELWTFYHHFKAKKGPVVEVLLEEVKMRLNVQEEEGVDDKGEEDKEKDQGTNVIEPLVEDDLEQVMDDAMDDEDDTEGEEEDEDEDERPVEKSKEKVEEDPVLKLMGEAINEAEKLSKPVLEEAEMARQAAEDIEGEVSRLEQAIRDLENEEKEDFGPENELWYLRGKCFSQKINKYEYEVCPYREAKQKEGHSSVSLGRWVGVEWGQATPGEGRSLTMKFENGQRCWNGPNRSMMVKATCGAENKVLSVDEPSMCEYVMEFTSPAACDLAFAETLKLDLIDEDGEEGGYVEPSSVRSEL